MKKKLLLIPTLSLTLVVASCGTPKPNVNNEIKNFILLGLDGLDYQTLQTKVMPLLNENAQENLVFDSKEFETSVVDSGNAWRTVLYGSQYEVTDSNGNPKKSGEDIFSKVKAKYKDSKNAAFYNWFAMNPNSYTNNNNMTWGVLDRDVNNALDDQFDADSALKENEGYNLSSLSDKTSDNNPFKDKLKNLEEAQTYTDFIYENAMKENENRSIKAIDQDFNFIFHYDTVWDDLHHGEFSYQTDNEIDDAVLDKIVEVYAKWINYYFSLDKDKWFVGVTTDHSRDEEDFNHTTDNAKKSWFISNQDLGTKYKYNKLSSFRDIVLSK
ncbi:hypothetical protein SCHIN_v1c03560 [Spiroplasma chinense]|uniref:Alkaline phosphatase n=1 Tax=Spiroplasma chinense TaxID=216932 RepID=A0A5B9Y467_9MOLU|nr:hypothetical protein [Spiroplasma chinense]QEH61553.1 hypothetical protein SCHIN_v1c03560 [Spiroplasma chinense]